MSGVKQFIKRFRFIIQARAFWLIFLSAGVVLASCQSSTSSLSETIVSRSAKAIRKAAAPSDNINLSENIVLLGKSAAAFYLVLAEGVPPSVYKELVAYLENRVPQLPFTAL